MNAVLQEHHFTFFYVIIHAHIIIRKVKMKAGEVILSTPPCHSLVDQGALTVEMVNV